MDLAKPAKIARAVDRALRSFEFKSPDATHEDRVWILTAAVSDALSPLVPRAEAVRRELALRERDRKLREGFNGKNHQALADKHGLSKRQVRRIVDHGSRRQPPPKRGAEHDS